MRFEDGRADRVFEVSSPTPGVSRADADDAPVASGFHLIDTTMMYAPRSGGVKRYLTAKGAWLAKRRPDIRHTLVVPGARTLMQADGLVTVASARLPFGEPNREPRLARARAVAVDAPVERLVRLLRLVAEAAQELGEDIGLVDCAAAALRRLR